MGAAIVVIIAIWAIWHAVTPTLIAEKYLKQLNFPVYAAKNAAGFNLESSSIAVTNQDSDTIISFDLINRSNKVTITEQAYPEVIIPDQFFAGLNEYDDVSSNLGKIVLARPPKNNSHQVAVATPNNVTMIFANPQKELSNDQWRQFFNSLDVVK